MRSSRRASITATQSLQLRQRRRPTNYNVLNAAARVVSNTRKFDRGLSQLLHDDLHWLDVPDRVSFKLIVTVHRSLNGRAPNYLLNHVIPVSAIVSWQRLRSAQQNTLQSINQSINVKFVGRRYTRRPGAPTVVSGTHDQKVHS